MRETITATFLLCAALAACDDIPTTNDTGAARDATTKVRDVSSDEDRTVVPPVDEGVPADLVTTIDMPQSVDGGVLPDHQEAIDRPTPHDVATRLDVSTSGRTVPVGRCGARRGLYFPENTGDLHGHHARTGAPRFGGNHCIARSARWLG